MSHFSYPKVSQWHGMAGKFVYGIDHEASPTPTFILHQEAVNVHGNYYFVLQHNEGLGATTEDQILSEGGEIELCFSRTGENLESIELSIGRRFAQLLSPWDANEPLALQDDSFISGGIEADYWAPDQVKRGYMRAASGRVRVYLYDGNLCVLWGDTPMVGCGVAGNDHVALYVNEHNALTGFVVQHIEASTYQALLQINAGY
ncbi:hypothetical protein [Chitinivorax sp. B]|uniref:hypothetical protein n=1 Tax=Chitinivorax sp. B TaxID=2502235 RepID=UPI0010F67676|nr:hypothetical protein [Chitinivorax sp. B]